MDLLERYLQAVRFFLPTSRQDDILRELSENLRSQMEDREEELGRALRDEEIADILRSHGQPMVVAGRYRSRQRLIGPALFPLYVVALKVGLAITLLARVATAAIAVLIEGDAASRAIDALIAIPRHGLMVFAWTTLAFAVVDMVQPRLTRGRPWDPRRLPKVLTHEYRIERGHAWFALLLTLACLVLVLLIPWAPYLVLGPADAFLALTPIWAAVYIPIVALTLAAFVLRAADVVRPYWTPGRSLARLVHHGLNVALFVVLLRAGELVQLKPGATLPHGTTPEQLLDVIYRGTQIGLAVATIVGVIAGLSEANRLRLWRKGSPPRDAAAAQATRG